ncbi:acylphosphatase [Zavarzinia compransoris]|uniref:acylphosphatase n=1 Tax=Zavarzinia marina TaxID=2911065 RepID=UPI001F4922E3|nr:acylphosphatase [Zavarzinia marina]MCF4167104.1 acylphosphatase [Zavarzinia marina]
MKTLRFVIRGKVQGVGYRHFAVGVATRLGLDGWVRNRMDGTVELLAHGDPAALDELLAACRRGPPAGWVDGIDISEDPERPPRGFRQEATV